MRRWLGVVVKGGWILLLLLPACTWAEADPQTPGFEVAVIAPFGEDYGDVGESVRNGILLAVEAQNQRGGVLGQPVRLILKESGCDYQAARDAAQSAINEDGVSFIIGAVCADASEGVAQIASEAGALQISPASVDEDLTEDAEGALRPLVFRIPVTDPDQGRLTAKFARERLDWETVGILHAEEGDYGRVLADAFTVAFEEEGGEVVARESYDQDAELFFEALDPVREADPDGLYMPGYHTVANNLVAQARTYGMFQPVIGSDGWHAPGLDLGVVEGSYLPVHYAGVDPRSVVATWEARYEERYQKEPDTLATLAYDTARVLFAAVEEAGFPDPVVAAQVLENSEYETVSGWMRFDEMHNPIKSMVVLRAGGNGLRFEERRFARPLEDGAGDAEDAEAEGGP